MKAHKVYRKAIKKNLKPYFANWLPGDTRELGEYGEFKGGIFRAIGNVRDFGIQFNTKLDPSPDNHEFGASGTADVNLYAKGKLAEHANAALEVSFNQEWAVYFKALEARANRIADKNDLGEQVLALYQQGKWQRSWVIITDLVDAGYTLAVVSASSDSRIVFEAEADIEKIDPLDISIGLDMTISKKISYQVNAARMQPLIGLSKVQMKFFKPIFNVATVPATTMSAVSPLMDLQEIVEVQPNELYFGQWLSYEEGED